ncbi:MAG: Trm112 family protein, partial [Thermoanaerobaculia bacterium]
RRTRAQLRRSIDCPRRGEEPSCGGDGTLRAAMAIQPQLLEILACPICKEEVRPVPLSEARRVTVRDTFRDKMRGEELIVEEGLQCVKCHRVYPIVSDIPVMLVDEAFEEA